MKSYMKMYKKPTNSIFRQYVPWWRLIFGRFLQKVRNLCTSYYKSILEAAEVDLVGYDMLLVVLSLHSFVSSSNNVPS